MPDLPEPYKTKQFISDWLATNYKAWELTDSLKALAAEFNLVAEDIVGTGIRVVKLQASKRIETDDDKFWYEPISQVHESRDIWAVVEGSPAKAVIIHLDLEGNELKALAWAEQERFRRLNS